MSTEMPTPEELVARMERAGLPRVAAGAVLLSVTLTCEEIEQATGARLDVGAVACVVVARILTRSTEVPRG